MFRAYVLSLIFWAAQVPAQSPPPADAVAPNACEIALRDQVLPTAVLELAIELARAHVKVHDHIGDRDLNDVRLVAHAPLDPEVLTLEAQVETNARGPRYVRLEFSKHLRLFAGRVGRHPSPEAAEIFAAWPREARGTSGDDLAAKLRFAPPRPRQLDPAGQAAIERVARRFIEVTRGALHGESEIEVTRVLRALPGYWRALVQINWRNARGTGHGSYYVVVNPDGSNFTSEDEPSVATESLSGHQEAVRHAVQTHFGPDPIAIALVQENGAYWAHAAVLIDGRAQRVLFGFGEDRSGRISAQLVHRPREY